MKIRGNETLGWWGAALVVLVAVLLVTAQEAEAAEGVCAPGSVRWSSSSNRIYVSGPGTVCTLTDIDRLADWAPLEQVPSQAGVWLLGANIVLENGATLQLHGTVIGGDVDELRLKSNNTGADNGIVYVRAFWGTIDIQNTKVVSWDEAAGGPDTEFGKYGRSYLQAKSYLDEGGVPRESRMDIIGSDVGYLGYYGAEAYGLSWKVLGLGADIFDQVEVRGDVRGSHIHHNFFGAYTYGAHGMEWRDNEIDNNVLYGLDAHDNSDDLVVRGNNVHRNGSHGIIASRYCDGLIISGNKSHDNGGNGIMLHRDTNDAKVENNTLNNNGDAALALFESHRNVLVGNSAQGNGRGLRLSVGSSDNVIKDNTFKGNGSYGIFFYRGSDQPVRGDGRPKNNTIAHNVIDGSGVNGLKLKEGDNNLIQSNTFMGGGEDLVLMDARGNVLESNTVTGNTSYGIQLRQGSVGNEVIGNTVENSRRGVGLREGSDSNKFKDNIIRGNSQYAVYIEGSSDNVFKKNVTEGNGRNYYYALGGSNNVIEDTPKVAVKVGDFESSMTLVDSGNQVFKTVKRVPTVVALKQSLLELTRYITGAVVDITQVDFVAVPSDYKVIILLGEDYAPGESGKWMAEAEGATDVVYKIGGWEPGQRYLVEKNGQQRWTVVADDKGKIQFSDRVAGEEENQYWVSLTSGQLSSPSPSPVPSVSVSPDPTVTSAPTPSPSPSASVSPDPTIIPTPTLSPSPTPVITGSPVHPNFPISTPAS